MRIFVTGASGFIGSAVVAELLGAGHQVVGLARSEASARAIAEAGAEVHRGSLEDTNSLRQGAESTDGTIHLAFRHDFEDFDIAAGSKFDRRAIEALGDALAGSDRPLVVAAGIFGIAPPGAVATEDQPAPNESLRASEPATLAFTDRGVRTAVLRLPPSVHGEGDHGFVPHLIGIARKTGVSGYPGDGTNRWPSVHRLDAARAIRLATESAPPGTIVHPMDDEGIPVRTIAEVIGRHLGLPVKSIPTEDVFGHFGWIGPLFALDAAATSLRTRELLGWQPTHGGLLDDLEAGHYFKEA
ncbi:3-beta hydroxysteroid dehydrogenase [Mycolicibacterium agri]|uniref:3-beta hydroxysteroid dehydrogenase n=1 Tax=Mycolicibacterium agri TaxID=36811 RepID=A0A2A7NC96_MYCAG|nr:SDR family oxidoreductase [Mycolicibacterium agri]PEG41439.1 3-beta hydroxysteroid dehydrogenase [Mycolicibacterium agri]GFG53026.1 putative NAD-dependent epimerase/dehydratase [Mycolicibacterium agri]